MRYTLILAAAALAALLLWTVAAGEPAEKTAAPAKIRIGTYDNRSIAVAYAASKWNPVREKMAEYAAAKKAGDAAKQKELETWGETTQRVLHFQGFGRVPVGDLLKPVEKEVAKLAADKQLAAIAMQYDFTAANVEVVDVTDDLVQLFAPTAKTVEMARQVRKVEPVSLTVLADMPANE